MLERTYIAPPNPSRPLTAAKAAPPRAELLINCEVVKVGRLVVLK